MYIRTHLQTHAHIFVYIIRMRCQSHAGQVFSIHGAYAIYTHTHTYKCIYIYMCIHPHTHTPTHPHTHTHTVVYWIRLRRVCFCQMLSHDAPYAKYTHTIYVCIYINTYIHIYIYTYKQTHTHTHMCIHVQDALPSARWPSVQQSWALWGGYD